MLHCMELVLDSTDSIHNILSNTLLLVVCYPISTQSNMLLCNIIVSATNANGIADNQRSEFSLSGTPQHTLLKYAIMTM